MSKRCAQRPEAELIPFPLGRRRDLVGKVAEQMLSRPLREAELHLREQMGRQIRAMQRKGFRDHVVEREVRSLEAAIRTELWHLVLRPRSPRGVA
jgi:hypothetical protein